MNICAEGKLAVQTASKSVVCSAPFVSLVGQLGQYLVGTCSMRRTDFHCLNRWMELHQIICLNGITILIKGCSLKRKKYYSGSTECRRKKQKEDSTGKQQEDDKKRQRMISFLWRFLDGFRGSSWAQAMTLGTTYRGNASHPPWWGAGGIPTDISLGSPLSLF